MQHRVPLRTGRVMPLLGLLLLGIFAVFTVGMKIYVMQHRHISNEQLLEELAQAEFLDEPGLATKDWPQWLGPTRQAITSMPNLRRSWPSGGLPILWKESSREAYSSFAVADGRVFTMIAEDDGEAVVCFALHTGKQLWKYSYPITRQFQYPGPRATPSVAEGNVYVLTPTGLMLCLQADDGQEVWKRDLVEELGSVPPRWGLASSPLVEGNHVYIVAAGSRNRCLAALHKDTGETVWTGQNDPPGYSSPIAATIGGVRQILFFTGNRMIGVRPDDGELLWEYPWKTQFEVNAATPLVFHTNTGSYVFISSGYDRGCGLLKIVRRGNGLQALRVFESDELCCHFATPVRYKDHIYGLDEKRDLTCLDLRTGKLRWRFQRSDEDEGLRAVGFKKGSLLRVDEFLLILGEDGKLALVEATPEAYREVTAWRPFRDRCWSLPVLVDGRLLMRDVKRILCVDARETTNQE